MKDFMDLYLIGFVGYKTELKIQLFYADVFSRDFILFVGWAK